MFEAFYGLAEILLAAGNSFILISRGSCRRTVFACQYYASDFIPQVT
jgi:hypothetical protein